MAGGDPLLSFAVHARLSSGVTKTMLANTAIMSARTPSHTTDPATGHSFALADVFVIAGADRAPSRPRRLLGAR